MTSPRVPETRKKPGVYYAVTDDGIELPIVDVTHPEQIEVLASAGVDLVILEKLGVRTRAEAVARYEMFAAAKYEGSASAN